MDELTWTDSLEVALALLEHHPDVDPKTIRFTDLQAWVMALPNFVGELEHCNERILEAIQMHWIDEID